MSVADRSSRPGSLARDHRPEGLVRADDLVQAVRDLALDADPVAWHAAVKSPALTSLNTCKSTVGSKASVVADPCSACASIEVPQSVGGEFRNRREGRGIRPAGPRTR
jgi:hypothetical protein